jgi:hypothetical protein
MAFNISKMVKFSPEFDNSQLRSSKLLILSFLETAYVKSPKAQKIFEDWGQEIKINFYADHFTSVIGMGEIKIDPTYLNKSPLFLAFHIIPTIWAVADSKCLIKVC